MLSMACKAVMDAELDEPTMMRAAWACRESSFLRVLGDADAYAVDAYSMMGLIQDV